MKKASPAKNEFIFSRIKKSHKIKKEFKLGFKIDGVPAGILSLKILKSFAVASKDLSLELENFAFMLITEHAIARKYHSELCLALLVESMAERPLHKNYSRSFCLLNLLFSTNEELPFEIARDFGAWALLVPHMIEKISGWLENPKTANANLNKLKDSLIKYYVASSPKDFLFKIGRPESAAFKILGSKSLRTIYKNLSSRLEMIKDAKRKHPEVDPFVVLEQELKAKFFMFQMLLNGTAKNEKLQLDIKSCAWQPNEMARKIMSFALNVSESKLYKILYLNRRQAPIV